MISLLFKLKADSIFLDDIQLPISYSICEEEEDAYGEVPHIAPPAPPPPPLHQEHGSENDLLCFLGASQHQLPSPPSAQQMLSFPQYISCSTTQLAESQPHILMDIPLCSRMSDFLPEVPTLFGRKSPVPRHPAMFSSMMAPKTAYVSVSHETQKSSSDHEKYFFFSKPDLGQKGGSPLGKSPHLMFDEYRGSDAARWRSLQSDSRRSCAINMKKTLRKLPPPVSRDQPKPGNTIPSVCQLGESDKSIVAKSNRHYALLSATTHARSLPMNPESVDVYYEPVVGDQCNFDSDDTEKGSTFCPVPLAVAEPEITSKLKKTRKLSHFAFSNQHAQHFL